VDITYVTVFLRVYIYKSSVSVWLIRMLRWLTCVHKYQSTVALCITYVAIILVRTYIKNVFMDVTYDALACVCPYIKNHYILSVLRMVR
jgi:hypothetical protein